MKTITNKAEFFVDAFVYVYEYRLEECGCTESILLLNGPPVNIQHQYIHSIQEYSKTKRALESGIHKLNKNQYNRSFIKNEFEREKLSPSLITSISDINKDLPYISIFGISDSLKNHPTYTETYNGNVFYGWKYRRNTIIIYDCFSPGQSYHDKQEKINIFCHNKCAERSPTNYYSVPIFKSYNSMNDIYYITDKIYNYWVNTLCWDQNEHQTMSYYMMTKKSNFQKKFLIENIIDSACSILNLEMLYTQEKKSTHLYDWNGSIDQNVLLIDKNNQKSRLSSYCFSRENSKDLLHAKLELIDKYTYLEEKWQHKKPPGLVHNILWEPN